MINQFTNESSMSPGDFRRSHINKSLMGLESHYGGGGGTSGSGGGGGNNQSGKDRAQAQAKSMKAQGFNTSTGMHKSGDGRSYSTHGVGPGTTSGFNTSSSNLGGYSPSAMSSLSEKTSYLSKAIGDSFSNYSYKGGPSKDLISFSFSDAGLAAGKELGKRIGTDKAFNSYFSGQTGNYSEAFNYNFQTGTGFDPFSPVNVQKDSFLSNLTSGIGDLWSNTRDYFSPEANQKRMLDRAIKDQVNQYGDNWRSENPAFKNANDATVVDGLIGGMTTSPVSDAAALLGTAVAIKSLPVALTGLKTLAKNEVAKMTVSDAAYKAGLTPSLTRTGIQNWQHINIAKAFSPKMLATGPTPAAGFGVAGLGLGGLGLIGSKFGDTQLGQSIGDLGGFAKDMATAIRTNDYTKIATDENYTKYGKPLFNAWAAAQDNKVLNAAINGLVSTITGQINTTADQFDNRQFGNVQGLVNTIDDKIRNDERIEKEFEQKWQRKVDAALPGSPQEAWLSVPENKERDRADFQERETRKYIAKGIFGLDTPEGEDRRLDVGEAKQTVEAITTEGNILDKWNALGEEAEAVPYLRTTGLPEQFYNLFVSNKITKADILSEANKFPETGKIDTIAQLYGWSEGESAEKLGELTKRVEQYEGVKEFIRNPIEGTRDAVQGFVQGAGSLLRSDRGGRSDLYASAGGMLQPSLGQFTADDLYERGQNASRSIAGIAALWEGQEQRDKEYQAELDRIREGQSIYTKELERIGTDKTAYDAELERLSKQKTLYQDEISKIEQDQKAWDTEYKSATEYRDKISAEVERLTPYDQLFRDEFRFGVGAGWDRPDRYGKRRSGDSWDREGKLIPGGISGREFLEQNDKWYRGTRTPYTTDLREKYIKYLDDMDSLKAQQTKHSEYLTGLEKTRDSLSSYLTDTQMNLSNLSNYFTDTQEGRDELNLYSEEIQKQSSAFNQYEVDYRKRRQENMDYRKSATINYQQQLADSQNQGVAGVRTNRNFYNQFSPNRRQSPRGTFNRDSWRIQNLNL